jgi:hypothetical protein
MLKINNQTERQQVKGVWLMADEVVNWTFYLASTFVMYSQVCTPQSAAVPSVKLLATIISDTSNPKLFVRKD